MNFTNTQCFTKPVGEMCCWNNDCSFCVPVNLYGSKAAVLWLCVRSTLVHQCLGISISKIFVDMILNTLHSYPPFLLKEHKVSTVPSSLTGNLLLRICSSVYMLLIGFWNTGKPKSKFAMALFLEFLPYMGSQNLI